MNWLDRQRNRLMKWLDSFNYKFERHQRVIVKKTGQQNVVIGRRMYDGNPVYYLLSDRPTFPPFYQESELEAMK